MSRSWPVRRGGARQAGRALAGSSVMYLHWIRFYPEAAGLGCVVYLHRLYVVLHILIPRSTSPLLLPAAPLSASLRQGGGD